MSLKNRIDEAKMRRSLFYIDRSESKEGSLEVQIEDEHGDRIPFDLVNNNVTGSNSEELDVDTIPDNATSLIERVYYLATQPGRHLIHIMNDKRHIIGSPFNVVVVRAQTTLESNSSESVELQRLIPMKGKALFV